MKTSINLYQESIRPKVYYLTLNNIAIVSGLLLSMVLGWYAFVKYENLQIEKRGKLIETELGFAQKEFTTYQQALVKHMDGASFNTEKQSLTKKLQAKKMLLGIILEQSAEDPIDYYLVMRDLTEHHDHDLWLTNFNFSEQNVEFNGFALQSKAVTQWLSYLQATRSFKGREFKKLDIKSINDDVVSFSTSTKTNQIVMEEAR